MTGKRPKRRIVLFLVEGKSEREALGLAIPALYDRRYSDIEVKFPMISDADGERGGDITSEWGVNPRNIEDKIYELFLEYFFDQNKILPKDISEIVQLVDMDGAFVPDSMIRYSEEVVEKGRTLYKDFAILTNNVEKIIKRNRQKRQNIEHLSTLTTIKVKQKTVKYSVYYFSTNIDHFLHHEANLEPRLKRELADLFSRAYIGKVEDFVRDIADDPNSAKGMNYEESWRFIKEEGANSLMRHTNLNILLEKLYPIEKL